MVLLAIDAGLLLDVVWQSLLAGIAVTVLFSLVVLFSSRSAEARRGSNAGSAMAYAGLTVLALVVFGGLVAFGVQVMLSKG